MIRIREPLGGGLSVGGWQLDFWHTCLIGKVVAYQKNETPGSVSAKEVLGIAYGVLHLVPNESCNLGNGRKVAALVACNKISHVFNEAYFRLLDCCHN